MVKLGTNKKHFNGVSTLLIMCFFFFFVCYISDIDECTWGLDDCSAWANCQNTQGSFVCLCREGFLSDNGAHGRSCEGRLSNILLSLS